MLANIFDYAGIVYQEFVLPSEMVSQHYYREVLQHMTEQVCQKHLTNVENQDWLTQYGKALVHSA
jgi:hypothetical protein